MIKLVLSYLISLSFASNLYVDRKKEWKFVGANVSVTCVTNKDTGSTSTMDDVFVSESNKDNGSIFIEVNGGAVKEIDSSLCYMEQTKKEQISRIEFLESLHSIECNYSLISFTKGDFRILRKNKYYIAAKSLNDGTVFIFSRKLCKMKEQLPRIDALARPLPKSDMMIQNTPVASP